MKLHKPLMLGFTALVYSVLVFCVLFTEHHYHARNKAGVTSLGCVFYLTVEHRDSGETNAFVSGPHPPAFFSPAVLEKRGRKLVGASFTHDSLQWDK